MFRWQSQYSRLFGILWILLVFAFYYLECSLYSWNFDHHEWNLLSKFWWFSGIVYQVYNLTEVILGRRLSFEA